MPAAMHWSRRIAELAGACWLGANATLAAGDDPIQPVSPRPDVEGAGQRLGRDEPHNCGQRRKSRQANVGSRLIFHGRPNPDVSGPATAPRCKCSDLVGPLRHQQPVEVWSGSDQPPQTPRCGSRSRRSSNTSAIDAQNTRARLPVSRAAASHLRGVAQVASVCRRREVFRPPELVAVALSNHLGISVLTGAADPHIAPPWVEGVIGPLNAKVLSRDDALPPLGMLRKQLAQQMRTENRGKFVLVVL